LRVILLDGKVIGGQAIGKYADTIGLLISAMWRKDDVNLLRRKWKSIAQTKNMDKLPQLRLGHIFGF